MAHIKGEIQIARRKGILERTRSQAISKRGGAGERGQKASTSGVRGREPSGQGSRVRTPRYTCSLKKAGSNLIVSLLTKFIRYKVRGRVVGARNTIEAWTGAVACGKGFTRCMRALTHQRE